MIRMIRPATRAGFGAAALALLLGNDGCAYRDPALEVAAACKQYATTALLVAEKIRDGELSADDENRVEVLDREVGPFCEEQSDIQPADALAALRRLTPQLLAMTTKQSEDVP